MTARVLEGRPLAERILAVVAERSAKLERQGITPTLAFISIGDSAEATMYLQRLQKLGSRNGVRVAHRELAANADQRALEACLDELNADDLVHGVIVQFPLPPQLKTSGLEMDIDPRKDVDGITIDNAGRLHLQLPGHIPSTARAMVEILDAAGIDPTGASAVVVGRSNIVGRPVAELLVQRNATVTIAHTRTHDLASVTRQAEILMVAAGRPGVVTGEMIRPGAVVIDAGINVTDHGLVGDVAYDECLPIASAITPVPGGVGPVTNAILLRSAIESAEGRRA